MICYLTNQALVEQLEDMDMAIGEVKMHEVYNTSKIELTR